MTKMTRSTNSLSEDFYCSERSESLNCTSCRCSSLLASHKIVMHFLVYTEKSKFSIW